MCAFVGAGTCRHMRIAIMFSACSMWGPVLAVARRVVEFPDDESWVGTAIRQCGLPLAGRYEPRTYRLAGLSPTWGLASVSLCRCSSYILHVTLLHT